MNKITLIVILVLTLCTNIAWSQTTDLARVEYTYFPQSDSDNSFRRFRTLVNVPLKLSDKEDYIVIGAEYRNINLKYNDDAPFEVQNLDRFQSHNLSLGYTFKLKNNWRFGGKAGVLVASNFDEDLESNDVIFVSSVYFIKDVDMEDQPGSMKNWRLILGLRYSTTAGRPFPLPVVNYNVRASENWSYTLGVPKTNLKYYFNEKNIVQSFVTLDGFFANIQGNLDFIDKNGNAQRAENISMTVALAGLGYEYYFTDHLLFYLYTGYTILNDIRLRDRDREDIFTINDTNSFYTRAGIKFKI